jgi:dihydrofolate reductase
MAAQKAPERITGTSKVLRRNRMSDTSTGNGKVVVNRSMSLDGYIAGPGHAMDWIFDFVAPDEFPEIAAATGAMLIGRRTYEVANRMDADRERGSAPSDETYPFSGPVFVLTHRPPEPPDPEVTFLTGDIGEAVATARSAAGGKNLEILGADVAGQCLQRGLVDEILVYVLPGAARRRRPPLVPGPGPGQTWNRSAARGRALSPSCGSASASSPLTPSCSPPSRLASDGRAGSLLARALDRALG